MTRDKIVIRDLQVRCIIGTNPEERIIPGKVLLNIVLITDLRKPGRSDKLEDAVDYFVLTNRIVEYLENSQYFLLEKMAEEVAGLCLAFSGVNAVEVTIDKPEALKDAGSVAVSIWREKE